ncbi:hypothetical protein [Nocardia tengchongensis]|uniref:hypothetical protein n=1 Tax=Nocardia tengchongensis TaxID=2055889 RepID=UPI0036B6CCC5
MLDRFGWILEVGDRVTVHCPEGTMFQLHGAHGRVLDFVGEKVEISLDSTFDSTVTISPNLLEYGHNEVMLSSGVGAGHEAITLLTWLREAVDTAVGESVISKQQGLEMLELYGCGPAGLPDSASE